MTNRLNKIFACFLTLSLILALMPAGTPANAAASELFISEYIEGSSFNKAVEIYNGTGAAVDLAGGGYMLELYSNGSPTVSQSVALSGTLADGDVYVIAHASADPAILAQADATSSAVINFNGDDAVVLRKNGVVVDAFGQIGFDPGSEWAGGGADDTLRRAETVCAGDTNANDAFDASFEWVVFGLNIFDGLGSHTANCGGGSAVADLFMSEYIEGSSFNKAIEIYNGTGAAVDLAAGLYTLELYSNGSPTVSQSVTLIGTLADGDVYVLAHGSADPAILAQADATSSAVINFNGDDAVVLRKNGVVIDAFGQIGFDPGSQWTGGGADDTLRRAAAVCAGDTNPDDAFDASVEWVVFPINTFDGLGSHIADCGAPPTTAEPVINEFSASTTGTDVEYVEFFGDPDTDYSAYTLLEIEGDSEAATGTVDEVIALGTTDASGFYLASLPANALENGTLSLLLVENFTGALGDDLDTDDNGSLDSTPWDAVVDAVAVNDGGAGDLTYGVPALGPNYDGVSSFAPGGASRIPDGFDTDAASDWVRNDFDLAGIPGFAGTIGVGEAYNTPGEPNQVYIPPPEACGDPFTTIYAVQGSGAVSPLVGATVSIEGVVVGDFQNNGSPDSGDLNGFHVQDPFGDGDPATSDGVFVYAPGGMDVAVGDLVRVRGNVSEFNGLTEVTASQIWVCSTGLSVAPTALSLPVASLDVFEPYEGMLVTFPQELVIAEYFNFDRFGEIVLSGVRHQTPTAFVEPGAAAIQEAQNYLLDRITLDDGRTNQNPDPAIHPNGGIFDLNNLFRGGDSVANVTGVMDYGFGLYRIQPTQGADYINTNPRTAAPDPVGGSLEVASFNVLNYFTTLDNGVFICGPLENQECRGADDATEFTRQRDKIIAAISAIDADVVGLIEIENHPADVPTADLVSGLNAALGAGTYDYIVTGAIGTDAIRQAFIYKPASVSPVGAFAVLDTTVDPRFLDDYNRPVLAQTFQDSTTGGVFTVAVNHLKSKGSSCVAIGDPDLGDGAGNCNLTRLAAAEALVDWLASDPTASGDPDFLIIGDLNSYDKEDPIDALLAGGYSDLIYDFIGEDAYSYVFDGQTGYLDYALADANLLPQVTGVTIWHINADEADLIDYDTSFKQDAQDAIYAPDAYRSSDHDPVVVGLNLANAAPEISPISLSSNAIQVNQVLEASAIFTDTNRLDTHTAVWDWGDGNTSSGVVTEAGGFGQVTGSHSYFATGIYTPTLIVMDNYGNSAMQTAQPVAVYDPDGGFLTGAGWFFSPAGAIPSNPDLKGRVVFNLLAKYTRRGNYLLGSNNFYLLATGDRFRSTRLDWLVVTDTEAYLRGEGRLNGQAGYQFMVRATDGPDRIRVKIWKETGSGEQVIYDNGTLQPLVGGRIVLR